MNVDPISATPAPRRRRSGGWRLLAAALVALAAFGAWRLLHDWRARADAERAQAAQAGQRLQALQSRVDALRRDQRAQALRLQQADATNRVLRDELLGIGQRAALIEDSVAKLADPDRHGAQALRLDEAELLLAQSQQRLALAGDLDGARRALALAAGVLDGVDDPAYLNLRQTLGQERSALDALGADPKVATLARLDAFAATLPEAPARAARAASQERAWWRRAWAQVVEVRPSDGAAVVAADDRAAGMVALQLELTLARAAAERRDAAGYRAALARADGWLARLWPASPERTRLRARLDALRRAPLALAVPTFGSTLAQLRALRVR